MNLTPDWVIGSPESLANVLAKDIPTWTAQVTMFNGAWIKKGIEPTDLVTLELTTFGKKEELLKMESLIVVALESMDAEVTTGENQRSHNGHVRKSWIFYKIPKGGENDQEETDYTDV